MRFEEGVIDTKISVGGVKSTLQKHLGMLETNRWFENEVNMIDYITKGDLVKINFNFQLVLPESQLLVPIRVS